EAPAEELAQRARLHDRAGEQVRPRLLPLLEHRDGDLSEPLAQLRVLLEKLSEADRAGETAGAAADDQDPDLDPLLRGIGRRADRVGRAEGRREVERAGHG